MGRMPAKMLDEVGKAEEWMSPIRLGPVEKPHTVARNDDVPRVEVEASYGFGDFEIFQALAGLTKVIAKRSELDRCKRGGGLFFLHLHQSTHGVDKRVHQLGEPSCP